MRDVVCITYVTRPRKPGRSPGAVAQLGERLPCTQEVSGSIPLSSTNRRRRWCVCVGSEERDARTPFAAGFRFSGVEGKKESRLERLAAVRPVAAVWVLHPEGSLTRWKFDSAIAGVEASVIDVVNV